MEIDMAQTALTLLQGKKAVILTAMGMLMAKYCPSRSVASMSSRWTSESGWIHGKHLYITPSKLKQLLMSQPISILIRECSGLLFLSNSVSMCWLLYPICVLYTTNYVGGGVSDRSDVSRRTVALKQYILENGKFGVVHSWKSQNIVCI